MKLGIGFQPPTIHLLPVSDITLGVLKVISSQIVLTLSNAVLATCLAVNEAEGDGASFEYRCTQHFLIVDRGSTDVSWSRRVYLPIFLQS
ncbi:MAG: hypothetical protein QW374_05275 [Candidatus Bathyarchaeia archaeon]|nr:hypothetical protein [Candidatus Bathyarchaeota archaeon]